MPRIRPRRPTSLIPRGWGLDASAWGGVATGAVLIALNVALIVVALTST